MTLKDFCALLASNEPAPGGGSASALSGVLAAGLGLMVINLTVGKKAYAALSDGEKRELAEAEEILNGEMKRLEELVDADADAFNNYMKARAMPKDDPDRKAAIEKATVIMTETPLETCRRCAAVAEGLITVGRLGNKNAASDAGTGLWMAMAGFKGASMNVRINLPSLADEAKKAEIIKNLDMMEKTIEKTMESAEVPNEAV